MPILHYVSSHQNYISSHGSIDTTIQKRSYLTYFHTYNYLSIKIEWNLVLSHIGHPSKEFIKLAYFLEFLRSLRVFYLHFKMNLLELFLKNIEIFLHRQMSLTAHGILYINLQSWDMAMIYFMLFFLQPLWASLHRHLRPFLINYHGLYVYHWLFFYLKLPCSCLSSLNWWNL